MEQHILGISGKKQSGKSTAAKFIHGYQMKYHDVVETFAMDGGDLVVNTTKVNEDGEIEEGLGVLEIERRDYDFINYAQQMIWPFVRSFSFADPLKAISIKLFGLTEEQCYGTDEDKNTPINIKWEDMPASNGREAGGFMTAREFLQYFGTDVCRSIKNDIWTSACISQIQQSGTEFAIIPDVRFPNEIEAIQKAGGKVIRLTRSPYEDEHSSETALDSEESISKFDHVIDNSSLGIHETNMELLKTLREWQWLKTKD